MNSYGMAGQVPGVRKHAQWCRIDNKGMFLHDLPIQFRIQNLICLSCLVSWKQIKIGCLFCCNTQATALEEPPVPSINAHLSLAVSFSTSDFSKPITSVLNPVSIPSVIRIQLQAPMAVNYRIFFMEKGNHRFLIRYGHIQAFQFRVLQNTRKSVISKSISKLE